MKFRVYDPDLKSFAYIDGLQFLRANKSKVSGKWGFEGQLIGSTQFFYAHGDGKAPLIPLIGKNCQIDRFTGLKDENGKELYENDKVIYSMIYGPDRRWKEAEIKWKDSHAAFVLVSGEMSVNINTQVFKLKLL